MELNICAQREKCGPEVKVAVVDIDIHHGNGTQDTEMEKVGDTLDIFFLAGANFWAILGNFWAIWAIFGHSWAKLGNFGSFLGYLG